MQDDDQDDLSKTPTFKIAAWIVLALIAIGLLLTVLMS